MDSAAIHRALKRLGELAHEKGLVLDVCVYGGTAFMLAYKTRQATRDVDAVMTPSKEGFALAGRVAQEMNLDPDWINDSVRQFLAPKGRHRELPLDWPGLRVYVPTADYLLALKALACRRPLPGYAGDMDDLRFLIRKLRIRSVEDIQARIDKYFPDDAPTPDQQVLLREIIQETQHGERSP